MATIVSWNGSSYTVPATGEENWGGTTKVDGLLVSLAQNGFNKAGGLFTLSSDVDFGITAGLVSIYYKSRGTVSTAGVIRLAKTESIGWRNNAASGNNLLTTDASDNLTWNGTIIASSTGVVPVAAGGTNITSYTIGDTLYASGATTLSKLGIGAVSTVSVSTGSAPSWALLVNANISASAAIVYSKLSLTGSVVNADINASAAIVYSKLSLTASIVNADVSVSAAIVYSKLSLSASLLSSDMNSGAATSGQVLTANGSSGAAYTTPPPWPGSNVVSNLGIATSVATNALTITFTDQTGATPSASSKCTINFRSATAGTGTFLSRNISAALTLVIPSGTTIGTASGVQHYLYVYAIDNAGTVEGAVSLSLFDEGSIQNTTAIAGGAAPGTLYSTTARTGVAVRLVARLSATEATAGTWATNASEVSNFPFYSFLVAARFTTAAGQSIANGATPTVVFGTKVYDSHNSFNSSTGVFTAPVAGKYQLSAMLTFVSAVFTQGASAAIEMLLLKNGSSDHEFSYFPIMSTQTMRISFNGTTSIQLAAGDTLAVAVSHTESASRSLNTSATLNWVDIQRIGN